MTVREPHTEWRANELVSARCRETPRSAAQGGAAPWPPAQSWPRRTGICRCPRSTTRTRSATPLCARAHTTWTESPPQRRVERRAVVAVAPTRSRRPPAPPARSVAPWEVPVRDNAATQRDAALHGPAHDPDGVAAATARRTARWGGVAPTRSRRRPWRPGANARPAAAPRARRHGRPRRRGLDHPPPTSPLHVRDLPAHAGVRGGARDARAGDHQYHGGNPCGMAPSRVLTNSDFAVARAGRPR